MAGPKMEKMTARQDKALAALLTASGIAEAAKSSGLGERTLFRYLRNPEFQAAYRNARTDLVRQTIAQIQRVSQKAAAVLEEVLTNSKATPSSRVMAARVLLETAIRAVEVEDLESRIGLLETQINEASHGNTHE